MKLFLFDLDGTLVSTGGAGLRALSTTFHELYQTDHILDQVDPSGKTDPAIFREIVDVFLKRSVTPYELDQISATYLTHLARETAQSPHYKILPGVHSFLNYLSVQRDVTVGLGTGNLEKGARIKLEPSGLNPFFLYGAFGSDAEDRSTLLRVGHERAAAFSEEEIGPNNVYIIGDTELDILAARKAGYKSVAVATGSRSKAILAQAIPHYILNDLTEGRAFVDSLRDPSEALA